MNDEIDRLMRSAEVRRALGGLSRTTLHVMVAGGRFPAPSVRLGQRSAWRASVVADWIEKHEADLRASQAAAERARASAANAQRAREAVA